MNPTNTDLIAELERCQQTPDPVLMTCRVLARLPRILASLKQAKADRAEVERLRVLLHVESAAAEAEATFANELNVDVKELVKQRDELAKACRLDLEAMQAVLECHFPEVHGLIQKRMRETRAALAKCVV